MRKHKRVLTLEIGGNSALAFLKEVQHDALGDTVLHVDFLRVDETKQIKVKVALRFVGHPKGLGNNGEFVHPMNDVEVECLPIAIPESIRVKVDHLDVGMQITAKELTIPQGVKLLSSPDSIVCTVHLKGLEPEPVAAAAEARPAEPERITKPVPTEEGETPRRRNPKRRRRSRRRLRLLRASLDCFASIFGGPAGSHPGSGSDPSRLGISKSWECARHDDPSLGGGSRQPR